MEVLFIFNRPRANHRGTLLRFALKVVLGAGAGGLVSAAQAAKRGAV